LTASSPDAPDICKNGFLAPEAKKVMTSFDLQAVARELESTIIGAKIENIYQISPLALLLSLHPPRVLILEAGRRAHMTRYFLERPRAPSVFCGMLRRHLRQGLIEGVGVEDFERVFYVKVSSKQGIRRLIVEVFGGGNILLLDEKDNILQALTYRRMRDRNILRGETYKLPPPRGISPTQVSPQELSSLRTQKGGIAGALGRTLGLGSPYVEEALLRAGIEKTLPAKDLDEDDIQAIYKAVRALVEDLGQPQPRIVVADSGGWLDVIPFPLLQYKSKPSIEFETYNDAADIYFTRLSTELERMARVAQSEAQVEEQKRILKQQQERLKELEVEASASQRAGDLLYVHFSKIQELLDLVGEAQKGKGAEQLLREKGALDQSWAGMIVSLDPSARKVRVRLEGQEIELDVRISVHENAKNFYERAKTARQKMEGLKQAIEEAEKRFKVREARMVSAGEQRLPRILRRRAWYEKFHWVKSKRGSLLVGGRDATANELLIKRHMEPNDLVFHADVPGAPFVLAKPTNGTLNEEDIVEAAQMAASYSSAWRAKAASTDVYWVKPEQVSKEAPSGEYLTRGAFMIRGQKNYVRNVQFRLSIGLVEGEEGPQVVGGPSEAVKAQTRLVVDIVPGRLSSGALAKEIRRRLASKKPELRQMILGIPLEELQRFIPPGGSEIAND